MHSDTIQFFFVRIFSIFFFHKKLVTECVTIFKKVENMQIRCIKVQEVEKFQVTLLCKFRLIRGIHKLLFIKTLKCRKCQCRGVSGQKKPKTCQSSFGATPQNKKEKKYFHYFGKSKSNSYNNKNTFYSVMIRANFHQTLCSFRFNKLL